MKRSISMSTLACVGLACLGTTAPGCLQEDVTRAEMRQALIEAAEQGQAMGMETDIIEITTDFTIGQGVQAVVEEVRAFVESQIPCSTVVVEPGKITMDFGDLADSCTYNGKTYAGIVSVEFEDQDGSFLVTHTYEALDNGKVTLDGTAVVTWNGTTRNVVTDLDFVSDDSQLHVEADRTQVFSICEGVAAICVRIDGDRTWTGESGEWDMTIDAVELRSIDPVPESGTYSVLTPQDKEVSMSFSRVDGNTIEVLIEGGRKSFKFHVTAAGQVSDGG